MAETLKSAAQRPRRSGRGAARGDADRARGLYSRAIMRLLFVLDQWPELSETFVVNELQALRRLGHDVRVQAAQPAAHANPEAPDDIDVHVLARDDRAPRRARPALARCGAARWPARATSPAGGAGGARSGRGRCGRWRPAARRIIERGDEHLHAHFAAGAALDAMRLAALTGRPFSVTAHAYDIFLTPRNLREKLERADAVFTGCDYNVEYLRRTVPRANLHKIVMGVDVAAFERSAPLPQGRTVLAIGRLVEKKGFDVLLDALAQLPDVRLRIVGDGPLRAQLAAQPPSAATGASSCSAAARRPRCAPSSSAPTCWRCPASSRATAIATRCRSSSRRRWRWGCSSSPATRSGCPSASWRRGACSRRPATPTRSAGAAARGARARRREQRRAGRRAARAWVQANTDVDAETARMATASSRRLAGATSTRRRGLSATVRQPALHRPALLARRLGRIEAAADDEHVEAAVAQRLPGSAPRCGTGVRKPSTNSPTYSTSLSIRVPNAGQTGDRPPTDQSLARPMRWSCGAMRSSVSTARSMPR